METLQSLLDHIKHSHGITSDNALAGELGVTRASVSGWRHGTNLPGPVACARIADLGGVSLAKVLGIVGEARAISREEKAVWRRLASAAAIAFVAVLTAAPNRAEAYFSGHSASNGALHHVTQRPIHYANIRSRMAIWFSRLRDVLQGLSMRPVRS